MKQLAGKPRKAGLAAGSQRLGHCIKQKWSQKEKTKEQKHKWKICPPKNRTGCSGKVGTPMASQNRLAGLLLTVYLHHFDGFNFTVSATVLFYLNPDPP